MRRAVLETTQVFGALHGVVHAAGIMGGVSFLEREVTDFHRVVKPKIDGTLVLEQALLGVSVEFICYFSSASAVLGDFGSCDYAVGNRFQLAYANALDGQGGSRKTFAICWPHWEHGGMGPADDQREQARLYFKSSGQRQLRTDEGLALFETVLA